MTNEKDEIIGDLEDFEFYDKEKELFFFSYIDEFGNKITGCKTKPF